MISRLKKQKGFTLIELLIVITIIGILAVALVPRITGGQDKARDAKRKADLQQLATAIELYADDNGGSYPSVSSDTCIEDLSEITSYMNSVPQDPSYDSSYTSSDSGAYETTSYCSTGNYTYIQLTDGYLLVAGLSIDDVTGEGIYDEAAFDSSADGSDSDTTGGEDAADVLDGNSGNLCSDCSSTGAIYVVGG